jgi:hypothetical protein
VAGHAKYLTQRAAMMQWWADYLDTQSARGEEIQSSAARTRDAIPAGTSRTIPGFGIKRPIATHARVPRPIV